MYYKGVIFERMVRFLNLHNGWIQMKITGKFLTALIAFTLVAGLSGDALADTISVDRDYRPLPQLKVPHGAMDWSHGYLYLVTNDWRSDSFAVRRYELTTGALETVQLQRYDSCCPIEPRLVSIDPNGSIISLEYTGYLNGISIYKHGSNGLLDLDWGREDFIEEYESEDRENVERSGEPYERGESAIDYSNSGGRLRFQFSNPRDMISQADGSVLVLDASDRYVYRILADGSSVEKFIGQEDYIPVNPMRLIQDSDGYLYLVDYYPYDDFDRRGTIGVFKFKPDGEWIWGWGEGAGGINDLFRSPVDLNTLLIDGLGNMMMLGADGTDWARTDIETRNHGLVYQYDKESGQFIYASNVQNQTGHDSSFVGIIANPEGGFIHIENWDFTLYLNYYTLDGNLTDRIEIDDLY